jgi:hypothetical protein
MAPAFLAPQSINWAMSNRYQPAPLKKSFYRLDPAGKFMRLRPSISIILALKRIGSIKADHNNFSMV